MIENINNADMPWSIAIFASRETHADLMETLRGVIRVLTKPAQIDLLINGNESLAYATAERVTLLPPGDGISTLRIWSIALGDKAHAWNKYVHSIWPGGSATFFMDGYVHPDRGAFELLERSMLVSSRVLGATGVPRTGRSSLFLRNQMILQGGLHGNLHCLKRVAMRQIIDIGFKLPLGIYRTDATLGAALMFGLDPAHNDWDPSRIQVQLDASWSTKKRHWWRFSDVRAQAKRILRQAQGELENCAIRQHFQVRREPVADLPETLPELITGWVERHPDDALRLAKRLFLYNYTLKKIRRTRDWKSANIPPKLIHVQNDC